jgi:hypothetical protein
MMTYLVRRPGRQPGLYPNSGTQANLIDQTQIIFPVDKSEMHNMKRERKCIIVL